MKLTYKKGKQDKIHISVDGEYCFTVDETYFLSMGIYSGKEVNDEYAHLLKKKVVITYEEFCYDRYGNRPQKTITCYWNGFRRHKDGYFIPMFKRITRDGTMSSKSISTELMYAIISMVEAE